MKSTIRLISTKDMDREAWLRYRKDGVGASEVGTIMGLNPYKSSLELFYDKIGEGLGYTVENIAMFLGKEQEEFIATLWEYWDPLIATQENMMENYRAGRQIRRCKRVNAYATNTKWPWLFVSLDREINITPDRGNGALELKTIGGYSADKWESGIPPSHIVQVNTQMGVCEYMFGEMGILKDNRDFMVYPFELNVNIWESIVDKTKIFWDKVTAARQIMTRRFEAERNFNFRQVEELNAELQMIEPEPDGSDAFNAFLKAKYKIGLPGEQAGTLEELAWATQHKLESGLEKAAKERGQLYSNKLKNVIRDGADRLDFGASGYVSWKANTNGARVFLNKVK